jgi:hypothetical protein
MSSMIESPTAVTVPATGGVTGAMAATAGRVVVVVGGDVVVGAEVVGATVDGAAVLVGAWPAGLDPVGDVPRLAVTDVAARVDVVAREEAADADRSAWWTRATASRPARTSTTTAAMMRSDRLSEDIANSLPWPGRRRGTGGSGGGARQ